jgi:hypothetical protein
MIGSAGQFFLELTAVGWFTKMSIMMLPCLVASSRPKSKSKKNLDASGAASSRYI